MVLYELAFSLGTPLYKLYREMPYDEFNGWLSYFEERPIDWRNDLRTFYLMQMQGMKDKKPHEVFPSLTNIFKDRSKGNMADKLRGSDILGRMMRAKGGKQLELDP